MRKVMADLFFEDIQEIIAQELIDQKFTRIAALTIFSDHKPRIFEEGIAADGNKIGDYKEGRYKQGREKLGRETGFVNLEGIVWVKGQGYKGSGQMKKDYGPNTFGPPGFGFTNERNLSVSFEVEKRYGTDIFALTDEEAERFIDLLGQLMFP